MFRLIQNYHLAWLLILYLVHLENQLHLYTRLKKILICIISIRDQMNAKCILGELLTTYLQPSLGVEEVMRK